MHITTHDDINIIHYEWTDQNNCPQEPVTISICKQTNQKPYNIIISINNVVAKQIDGKNIPQNNKEWKIIVSSDGNMGTIVEGLQFAYFKKKNETIAKWQTNDDIKNQIITCDIPLKLANEITKAHNDAIRRM